MRSHRKENIDARVARELGLKRKDVSKITASFLAQLVDVLTDLDEARLSGFGTIRLSSFINKTFARVPNKSKAGFKVRRVSFRQFRVQMKKSDAFDRTLRAKQGPSIQEEHDG